MSLIVKWYESRQPPCLWYIRGIDERGNVYGEVKADTMRRLEFRLSDDDTAMIHQLVDEIRTASSSFGQTQAAWRGLLAEGDIKAPKVIAYYYDEGEHIGGVEEPFSQIIGILNRYLNGT